MQTLTGVSTLARQHTDTRRRIYSGTKRQGATRVDIARNRKGYLYTKHNYQTYLLADRWRTD